jgi:hypothetical protein
MGHCLGNVIPGCYSQRKLGNDWEKQMEWTVLNFACSSKEVTVLVQIELSLCFQKQVYWVEYSTLWIPVNSDYLCLCQEFKNNKSTCFCENLTIISCLDIFINIIDYLIQLGNLFTLYVYWILTCYLPIWGKDRERLGLKHTWLNILYFRLNISLSLNLSFSCKKTLIAAKIPFNCKHAQTGPPFKPPSPKTLPLTLGHQKLPNSFPSHRLPRI